MKGGLLACVLVLLSTGCRRDMFYQPKGDPLKPSDFFADGGVSRPLVSNTIAVGQLKVDQALYAGMIGTNLVTAFPFPITREVMDRGRQRFEIYCAPCHGYAGKADGMVVQRGFPPPPSYHIERLRDAPVGHFYHVISHGYGVMYSYAGRLEPRDRWAVAAYIRALQLAQHATLADVPEAQRAKLEEIAR